MANYITSFSSTTAYDEAMNLDFPNVSLIESDGSLKYAKTPDYSKCYFTIVSEADNNVISINHDSSAPEITVSASTDNGATWVTYSSGNIATLNNGDKVLLKGVNTAWGGNNVGNMISSNKNFHVEGNVMSLLYGDSFIGQTSLPNVSFIFRRLFNNSIYLKSAENLIFPATTLKPDCYREMFKGCTSLTTAPILPATTLAQSCCEEMFSGCISLTTAPALPATALGANCYKGMFQGCSGLTTAPVLPASTMTQGVYFNMFSGCTSLATAPILPATTLERNCYKQMFNRCSNLNYVKCLATDISASNCTNYWLNDISSTGTFVKDPSMSSWTTGVSGIPSGWTVQDASA